VAPCPDWFAHNSPAIHGNRIDGFSPTIQAKAERKCASLVIETVELWGRKCYGEWSGDIQVGHHECPSCPEAEAIRWCPIIPMKTTPE